MGTCKRYKRAGKKEDEKKKIPEHDFGGIRML